MVLSDSVKAASERNSRTVMVACSRILLEVGGSEDRLCDFPAGIKEELDTKIPHRNEGKRAVDGSKMGTVVNAGVLSKTHWICGRFKDSLILQTIL